MSLEQDNSIVKENPTVLNDIFHKYFSYWPFFLISIFLCISLAWLKLRYTTPIFEAKATIIIKNDNGNNNVSSNLAVFENMGLIKGRSNIENEIEILKSRKLMQRVIRELDLNIRYFVKEGRGPLLTEKYNSLPIHINFHSNDNFKGKFQFGKTIKTNFDKIIITPGEISLKYILNKEIKVEISPIEQVAQSYSNALEIKSTNEKADIINIKLKDQNQSKCVDLINNLIEQHQYDAIEEKNEVSKNTSEFINERMKLITSELSTVEKNVESFKSINKIVDIPSEAGYYIEGATEIEKQIIETNTQLFIVSFLMDYLSKYGAQNDVLPSNLGFSDATINQEISGYNKLVLEKNRLLKNSSDKNPIGVS
jgi:uncharacterized protein involved in exopolysaccharide biosynthesis